MSDKPIDPMKTIRALQNPVLWTVAIDIAADFWRMRAETLQRALRGEPEPPEMTGQCRRLSALELQQHVARFDDELKAVAQYVREKNAKLLPLVPALNLMFGDVPKFDATKAAENMRTLEAELTATAKPTKKKETGRRKKSDADAGNAVRIALKIHHKYDEGNVDNHAPASLDQLAKLSETSKSSVTRFLQSKLGEDAHRKYKAICNRGTIAASLTIWLGEVDIKALHDAMKDLQDRDGVNLLEKFTDDVSGIDD